MFLCATCPPPPIATLFPYTTLFRSDWQDRSQRPHRIQRTKRSIENLVMRIRTELEDRSILGEYGAEAIQRDLVARGKREIRSEEHTSELQSRSDIVCRLLLEKKKYI